MAITFLAELKQSDGTLIATRTLTSYTASITETFDLTSGERAAITNWSALEIWFSHTGTDGQTVVTQAYLEYPAEPQGQGGAGAFSWVYFYNSKTNTRTDETVDAASSDINDVIRPFFRGSA